MSTQTIGGPLRIASPVQLITEKIPSRVPGVAPLWIAYQREYITHDDLFERASVKWGMGTSRDSVLVSTLTHCPEGEVPPVFVDDLGPQVTVNVDGERLNGTAIAIVPENALDWRTRPTYYVRLDSGERMAVKADKIDHHNSWRGKP